MKKRRIAVSLVATVLLVGGCSSSGAVLTAHGVGSTTPGAGSTPSTAASATSGTSSVQTPSPSTTAPSSAATGAPLGTGPIADAARATLATSAQVTMTVKLAQDGQPDIPPISMNGSYDMRADVGELTATLGPNTVHEVFTKSHVYSSPAGGVPAGKWLAVSRTDLKVHYLFRTPGNDPAAFVRQAGQLTDVKLVGSEALQGKAMKHFRGTYDMTTLTEYLAPDVQKQLAPLAAQLGPISADVWVDGSGRVAQIAVSYNIAGLHTDTKLILAYPGGPAPEIPSDADTVVPNGPLSKGILTG